MKKKLISILVILFLINIKLPCIAFAFYDTLQKNTQELDNNDTILKQLEDEIGSQIRDIDTSDIDKLIDDIKGQGNPMIGQTNMKQLIRKISSGNFNLDPDSILKQIINTLFNEMIYNLGIMGQIAIISIVCGILKNFQKSFKESSVSEIAYFACYIVVVILIVKSFVSIMDLAKATIFQMVSFMQLLSPILLALLLAVGGVTSSAILQPGIAMMVGMTGTFIQNTLLPLIIFTAILVLINHISNTIKLDRLVSLSKSICTWTLGITFTVFIGLLVIQGAMAASFDGISIRTAKYTIETFVPVVGGFFSQTVDTIIGCSLLVKNAVGIAGLIVTAMVCIYPAIRILSLVLLYRLTSALLEPISDMRIVKCLDDMGGIFSVLFITVTGVAIMFFITITLIIGAGNISTMMR